MTEPLVLRIDELRLALSRVLAATEQRLGAEVALEGDYYWHIPVDDAFDVTQEPGTITVVQLSDDLASVHEETDVQPETAWHELSHLVGLLRALERLAKS